MLSHFFICYPFDIDCHPWGGTTPIMTATSERARERGEETNLCVNFFFSLLTSLQLDFYKMKFHCQSMAGNKNENSDFEWFRRATGILCLEKSLQMLAMPTNILLPINIFPPSALQGLEAANSLSRGVNYRWGHPKWLSWEDAAHLFVN